MIKNIASGGVFSAAGISCFLRRAAALVINRFRIQERVFNWIGPLTITEGGDYILHEGSCWIQVGNLSVYVKEEAEGVAVDIYPLNDENSDSLAATYAFFADAEMAEAN